MRRTSTQQIASRPATSSGRSARRRAPLGRHRRRSNSFANYQADACHAYQIMKKNGVPESNIILMMYDDIAGNAMNPPASPSMFTGDLLANDTKVYATTAASGMESSWGCYCGTESKVDGKSLSTCLGDLYSVSWMENSDLDAPAETLAKQYRVVKRETNKSHVQLFGDQSFARDYVVAQGDGDDKRGVAARRALARTGSELATPR
ncbi:cysteine-type peptidase [Aureococcus anophagefferens]|nr:cysteine-type peptidase [Aureococcus anophagefferens]